jgi:hypothetical protein
MSAQNLKYADLSPGLKEALDFYCFRTPINILLTTALEHPDLFLVLSADQQNYLIESAFKLDMSTEAFQLCEIRIAPDVTAVPGAVSLKARLKALSKKKAMTPALPSEVIEFNAIYHPMRNVLSSIKTTQSLLGLAHEQVFISHDQLSDIADSIDDPGLEPADADLIEQMSVKIRVLFDELSQLSEYFSAKAGMV